MIEYSGDNVSSVQYTGVYGGDTNNVTYTYSNYDSKNNFWLLLKQATKNPFATGFLESIDAQFISVNNVGTIVHSEQTETFEYGAYNSAGYPTSIINSSQLGEDTYSTSNTIGYSGCDN